MILVSDLLVRLVLLLVLLLVLVLVLVLLALLETAGAGVIGAAGAAPGATMGTRCL